MVTFVGCNGCAVDNTHHNGDMEIADWSRRTMIKLVRLFTGRRKAQPCAGMATAVSGICTADFTSDI